MASDDDDLEFSGDGDGDDGISKDKELLERVRILAESNPSISGGATATTLLSDSDDDGNGEEEDDLELVRSIHERYAGFNDNAEEEPLTLKPLRFIDPDGDGEELEEDNYEDDVETANAIKRRFAAYNYDSQIESKENNWHLSEQVGVSNIASEKEASNNLFLESSNAWEGFPNYVDIKGSDNQNSEASSKIVAEFRPSNLIEWEKTGADTTAIFPVKEFGFSKSAEAFVLAIKKNRACQKFIRAKLIHIEARIEEIRKLKERVKILKDFQVGCRKRTGRALSQKMDARVQLISLPKLRVNTNLNEKSSSAIYYGPAENCQVGSYKEALKQYLVFGGRESWTKGEVENLAKGVKQQFQEMLLQRSLDLVSGADGSLEDFSDVDGIFACIRDHDITPENMRLFIPKVNWDQLASMYVPGRSGAECQARWLNCDDPLINRNPWSTVEDKNLLHVVQEKGLSNWIDIAVSLGTNRTPFQCLARYQRSLNASILKREWTEEDDNQLRAAVEAFGERNWQAVASTMEGRVGTQCSNRWNKTLNPARQKVGRWTPDEDKRLKVAVMLFGPKTWNKIAQFVPGRTQVQCRERWVNSLDPSLNMGEWIEEEDLKLQAAISEHGYCWSKVAACVPRRTDNQCWRRWKLLSPEEVPLLQAARKLQRNALMSNFVDRELERPALGPNDFVPLPAITGGPEHENAKRSRKQKRRRRRRGANSVTQTPDTPEIIAITNGEYLETSSSNDIREGGNNLNQENRRRRSKPKSKDKISTRDAASKEKARECHSEKDVSCETECHPSCLTEPSLSMITHGEQVGELGRDNEGGIWSKKASKLRPRRKSYHREVNRSSSTTSGEDVVQLCRNEEDTTRPKKASKPQKDVREISNSIHLKTIVGKKSKVKSISKNSDHTGDATNRKALIAMGKEERKRKRESPAFPGNENACKVLSASKGDFKLQNGNAGTEGQIQDSSSPVRCSTPDILESEQAKALDFREHNKRKSSNVRKFRNKILEEKGGEEEEDNGMTLASFLKKSRRAKTTLRSCTEVDGLDKKNVENAEASSVKNWPATILVYCRRRLKISRNTGEKLPDPLCSGESGDNDITLAVFCNKLKRRKTESTKE